MNSHSSDIQARLERLQQDYARQLPDKIQQIERLWRDLSASAAPEALQQLIRLCHNLAGSGTSYGFAQVTDQCRQLERLLRSVAEQDRPLETLSQQINHHLGCLTELATRTADSRPTPDHADNPGEPGPGAGN